MAPRTVLFSLAVNGFIAGTLFAQEAPDPNPVPNSDGTYTYYSGHNMQWTPSEAVDDSNSGDEVVIMGGSTRATAPIYADTLDVNKQDLVIRPNTCNDSATGGAGAGWDFIILRNSTQGPGGDNYVIRVGPNTQNTYIGRPPEITELANGSIILTQVQVSRSQTEEEYGVSFNVELVPMVQNSGPFPITDLDPNYTQPLLLNQNLGGGNSGAAGVATRLQSGFGSFAPDATTNMNQLAFRVEARAIDKVAVYSEGSQATMHSLEISTEGGFGGGIIVSGADDMSSYVNCIIRDTFSDGQDLNGSPIHAVTIADGNPFFAGCMIINNVSGTDGIVAQIGGTGTWSGCLFGGDPDPALALTQIISDDEGEPNNSPVSNGIYCISGGAVPSFFSCTFSSNQSKFGTVYFDSTNNADNDIVCFSSCQFENNGTLDNQWGATAYCVDAVPGRSPLIVFDRSEFRGANNTGTTGGSTHIQHDVVSNFFPRYRVLRDITTNIMVGGVHGNAGVGNADNSSGDSAGANPADINGDGIVDGVDLAIVLGAWD